MLATLAILLAAVQTPDDTLARRAKFHAGFGIGPVALRYECDGCPERGSASAVGFYGRLGVPVARRWVLGLELQGWKRQDAQDRASLTALSMTYYPGTSRGFFVRAGGGMTQFSGVSFSDGPTERGSGFGSLVALGNDLRIDQRLALTPMVTLSYSDIGTTTLVGFPERRGTAATTLAFMFGMTWR
jgi:hypothetical protein